jgi:glycosyltransferase involved in cell wall biosynthesis
LANQSKIRLLIFTPTMLCGGSEKFVSILCNHIDTEKFLVYLVVLNNETPFYKITNPAVEVVDLGERRVRFSLFKIKRLVKNFQPDIIFSTANHLNLYFSIFRRWFPEQIKFLARESSIVSINSQRAKLPALYNRLIKKYYNRFDLIVCQSIYMQQDLIHHYKIPSQGTVVIHNAVEPLPQSAAAVNNMPPARIYKFITVARLSQEKGIERLIHAVGLLLVPFQFYIIGEGDKRKVLQGLVNELQLQDKIFLQGEKTDPFSGMEDADLFLMGSYYEGFPNALLEAHALGIPAIAFNAPGGIAEIIIPGENGLLVDDNDILGFAAAIKRGLDLNPMAAGFNRNKIIETTQERFSIAGVVAKAEEVFTKLVAGSM